MFQLRTAVFACRWVISPRALSWMQLSRSNTLEEVYFSKGSSSLQLFSTTRSVAWGGGLRYYFIYTFVHQRQHRRQVGTGRASPTVSRAIWTTVNLTAVDTLPSLVPAALKCWLLTHHRDNFCWWERGLWQRITACCWSALTLCCWTGQRRWEECEVVAAADDSSEQANR